MHNRSCSGASTAMMFLAYIFTHVYLHSVKVFEGLPWNLVGLSEVISHVNCHAVLRPVLQFI